MATPSPRRPRLQALRVWAIEHPVLSLLLAATLLIVGGLGGTGAVLEAQKQARAAQAYAGVSLTARAVDIAIANHTLKEVRWYTLLADTVQATPVYNLTFRDGSQGWIETFALPDSTKQHLRDTATVQSVRFILAGTTTSTNPAFEALGTVGLILVLGVVLIGGQRWLLQSHSRMRFQAEGLNPDLTFDQVVGYAEVKEELREVLSRFRAWPAPGAIRPPRGLLLVGPPGVGKTLFAKALANESQLAFFSLTGADFADTFVGVGSSRVRQLFARARQAGGALIFIDEIDAVGNRHQLGGGGDSERLAVINSLLAELDGVNESGRILVVGATNYPERVDPALLRPGRLGHQIRIPLPDWATRRALLERHLGAGLGAGLEVDLDALSGRTTGLSGADLTQLVEEAQVLAQREGRLTQAHLHLAHEKTLLGSSRCQPHATERVRVAIHELGHALVGHLRCPHRVMDKITIQGRGQALGFTLHRPLEERHLQTEAELQGALAMLLGGRVAEQLLLGSASDGAAGDLAEANRLAQRMVEELGLGERLGLVTGQAQDPAIAALALADRQAVLQAAEAQARADIAAHRSWLDQWTQRLVNEGTLDADQALQAIVRPASNQSANPARSGTTTAR